MSDSQQEKLQRLYEGRLKAETELNCQQQKILDALANGDRRVRVERLVKAAEEAMTKAFAKNEQLVTLSSKTDNEEAVKADLEKWLNDVSTKNDEVLRKAREYIDNCPKADQKSHSSADSIQKASSKKSSTANKSRSSSQRQKELLLAIHRREELERQNESLIRLAKQKQELELKKLDQEKERLEQEQAIRLQELEEENRQKLAEARLNEIELTEDVSETASELRETLSQLSVRSQQTTSQRITEWVNAGNNPVSDQLQPPTSAVTTTASDSNVVSNLVLPSLNNIVLTTEPFPGTSSLPTEQRPFSAVTANTVMTTAAPSMIPSFGDGNTPMPFVYVPPAPLAPTVSNVSIPVSTHVPSAQNLQYRYFRQFQIRRSLYQLVT